MTFSEEYVGKYEYFFNYCTTNKQEVRTHIPYVRIAFFLDFAQAYIHSLEVHTRCVSLTKFGRTPIETKNTSLILNATAVKKQNSGHTFCLHSDKLFSSPKCVSKCEIYETQTYKWTQCISPVVYS